MPQGNKEAKWARIHAVEIIRGFVRKARHDVTLDDGKQAAPAFYSQAATRLGQNEGADLLNVTERGGGDLNSRATGFLAGWGLRKILVQDFPDRRKAAAAARAAAEASIDRAWRPRAQLAVNSVPHICVANNIAGTDNH